MENEEENITVLDRRRVDYLSPFYRYAAVFCAGSDVCLLQQLPVSSSATSQEFGFCRKIERIGWMDRQLRQYMVDGIQL